MLGPENLHSMMFGLWIKDSSIFDLDLNSIHVRIKFRFLLIIHRFQTQYLKMKYHHRVIHKTSMVDQEGHPHQTVHSHFQEEVV